MLRRERKVQTLTFLDVSVHENHLLLIEAKGISEHEQPGLPKLVPTYELGEKTDGILELDFINQPVEYAKKESVTFEIRTVIDLGKLPDDLKGIKVNAEENADIVLML